MTKSELIVRLAAHFPQLVASDAELAVKMILDAMSKSLSQGHRIEIRGFGSFGLNYRPPRSGAIQSRARRSRCRPSTCRISRPARNCASAWTSKRQEVGGLRPLRQWRRREGGIASRPEGTPDRRFQLPEFRWRSLTMSRANDVRSPVRGSRRRNAQAHPLISGARAGIESCVIHGGFAKRCCSFCCSVLR